MCKLRHGYSGVLTKLKNGIYSYMFSLIPQSGIKMRGRKEGGPKGGGTGGRGPRGWREGMLTSGYK